MQFVTFSGSGGLDHPGGLVFGPDGNLYVANYGFDGNRVVSRFQGPSGKKPGAFLGTFVPAGSGGLQTPTGLIFGPDGNGDGRQDLYVATARFLGAYSAEARTSKVLRYDGVTGAFLDTFVTANSGGLDDPNSLIFTDTDPTTLAYIDDEPITLPASGASQSFERHDDALLTLFGGLGASLGASQATSVPFIALRVSLTVPDGRHR